MKKILSMAIGSLLALNAQAENIIDVFGVDHKQSEIIIHKYQDEVTRLAHQIRQEITAHNDKLMNDIGVSKQNLVEKIKKEQNLLYVDVNTVYYPNNPNVFTTIEVVKKGDKKRLQYTSIPRLQEYPQKKDLIQKMIDYTNVSFSLMINNKIKPEDTHCPFHHCTAGFNDPTLKPFLTIFKNAEKESALILNTLNKDKNPERRAAAAFLVGCFNNPQKIIYDILPAIKDKDGEVRNNAMRVIGATMESANIQNIKVEPFIELLHSTQESDRNKALYVLSSASKNKALQKIIVMNAGDVLLQLLALKQPNNHEPAYQVLKNISSKDFGDNLSAWTKWIKTEQKSITV